MADGTDNSDMPQSLRALREEVGELKNDMRDVKARLASIESIPTLHPDQIRTITKMADIIEREMAETDGWLEGLGLIERKPRESD
jgi:hypothetical protein